MNIEIFIMPALKTHKEQSEFCKARLKEICEEQYSYSFSEEQIDRNEYGKPFFKDNEHLHFNISHTNGMGAIVVDDEPCGVDIEAIRDVKLSMAQRFFTAEEAKWIEEACDENEKHQRFFTVWTGKEAYTKMLGCGLAMKMNSFNVLSDEIKELLEYHKEGVYLICVCRGKRGLE